jgi:P27 family predicted phage terminase small subunit
MKELEGNPGKRPLNDREPRWARKAPTCPSWLEPEAKREWKRLCKPLEMMGILTEADRAEFATYCQAYARWKQAEEYISLYGSTFETDKGYKQQVPQVSIAQTYMKIMQKAAAEFGLTPSARSRIIASAEAGEFPTDEMDELLEG